jgi:hypothetical protein
MSENPRRPRRKRQPGTAGATPTEETPTEAAPEPAAPVSGTAESDPATAEAGTPDPATPEAAGDVPVEVTSGPTVLRVTSATTEPVAGIRSRPAPARPTLRRPPRGTAAPASGPPSGWRRRPGVAVALVAVAIAVIVGLGQLLVPSPSGVDAAPVQEPVASTELVCPVTTATDALVSTVTAGVAPLPTVSRGVATLADLTTKASASEPLLISKPGGTVSRVITGKPGPAQLARATGSFAAGFGADQMIRSGQGSTRGLAASPCARPITDGWLVGGGSTVGRLTTLLLVNDDDRPAQVDLTVYGPNGAVPAPGGSGLVLPPSSRTQVRLDSLAPNEIVTAVHVQASSGRIGVSALDQQVNGLVPLGMSLLPATQPGLRLVIPDVPQPVAAARLDLLSPDVATTVSLQLLTPEGSIVPAGIDQVDLQAGHVTSIDLLPVMAGEPAAVVVSASSPVVAGLEVVAGSRATLLEADAAAATPALTAPGIVVGLAGGALRHAVTLAAPGRAAEVRFDLYVPGTAQPTWTSTVEVPAGSIRRVPIPVTTATASSILVVTPVSGGPVHAGREVTEAGTRGPMLALAPIYPTRASTLVPPVVSVPGSSVR